MTSIGLTSMRDPVRAAAWVAMGLVAGAVAGVGTAIDRRFLFLVGALAAGILVAGLRTVLVPAILATQVYFEAVIPTIIILGAVLVVAAEMAVGRARIAFAAPLAWFLGYVAWAAASGTWTISVDRTLAAVGVIGFGLAIAISIGVLVTSRADLRTVLRAIVMASAISAIVGVAQYVSGLSDRSAGFSGDPNIFAMYQLVALPIAFVLAAQETIRWAKLVAAFAALAITASIFASLSRGGLLALIALVLFVLLLPTRVFFRSAGQRLVVSALFVGGLVVLSVFVLGSLTARIDDTETAAGSGRANEWRAGTDVFRADPLTGIGLGAFYEISNQAIREASNADLKRFRLANPGYRVHSAYIGTAAELGVPGLVLFIAAVVSLFAALARMGAAALSRDDLFIARIAFALVAGLAGWAGSAIFLSAENSFILLVILGLTLVLHKLTSSPSAASTRAPAAVA